LKEDVRINSAKDDNFGVHLGTDLEENLAIYLGSENCKHLSHRLKHTPYRLTKLPHGLKRLPHRTLYKYAGLLIVCKWIRLGKIATKARNIIPQVRKR
jgi:hypothetical protein